MATSNIIPFPQPDHGLQPEELADRILGLSDEIALLLSGEEPVGLIGVLVRVEEASLKPMELGDLVLRGVDRLRAQSAVSELQATIGQACHRLSSWNAG